MKTNLAIGITSLFLLIFSNLLRAQESNHIPTFKNNVITTSTGFQISKGQKLKIGIGSMPDGDFKYIRINSSSIFHADHPTENQAHDNQSNAFSRSNSGLNFKVIRNEQRGTTKRGYVYYTIISDGLIRYEIDVENAIRAGELITNGEFTEVHKNAPVTQPLSVADELIKLKRLRDEGILSAQEFEQQKQKLLSK